MKRHLKNINFPLFAVVLLLSLFGLVMVYSASFVYASLDPDINNPAYYFNRQRVWVIAGFIVFIIASLFSYRRLGQLIPLLIVITIVLLVAIFIPGLGVSEKGATRWLNLGPIPFLVQPSEIAKITMLVYFAKVYTNKQNQLHNFGKGVLPPLIILGIVFILIVLQPDLGTATSILIACGIILLFAGIRLHHLLGLGMLAGAIMFFLINSADYRMERILSFRNPFEDPTGQGYQLIHSYIAIATGDVTGVGLANSVQKSGFLPEAHTDFIMAVIAEELGLIGVFFVIALYIAFMFIGISIAKNAPDRFGKILALGITFQIVSQAIINMAAVSGLMPITGITLPLISYGGASMLITFALLGILMNIAIRGNLLRKGEHIKKDEIAA